MGFSPNIHAAFRRSPPSGQHMPCKTAFQKKLILYIRKISKLSDFKSQISVYYHTPFTPEMRCLSFQTPSITTHVGQFLSQK